MSWATAATVSSAFGLEMRLASRCAASVSSALRTLSMPRKALSNSAALGSGGCDARFRNSLRNASKSRRADAYEGNVPRLGASPKLA